MEFMSTLSYPGAGFNGNAGDIGPFADDIVALQEEHAMMYTARVMHTIKYSILFFWSFRFILGITVR